MKKIVILCCLFVFTVSAVANAEIKIERNDSGFYAQSISEDCSPIHSEFLCFSKFVNDGEVFYRLTLRVEARLSEDLIKNKPLSIRIEGYPIFYFDDYHYKSLSDNVATIEATVDMDMIKRLKKAKKGSLYYVGFVGIIPLDNILAEWKQVIAMEK